MNFADFVSPEPNSGCWLWCGAATSNGYGSFGRHGKAHRVAYESTHGPIPAGLCVCHTCDVRACVNPSHLFLGTHADNNRDMARKGRLVNPCGEDHGRSRLNAVQVAAIRSSNLTGTDLAKKFGVSHQQIYRIRAWLRWVDKVQS
jgi:hypothetical protein